MTKVYGITDKNFYEFIKKINRFNQENDVLATQTHHVDNSWFAIVYYRVQGEKKPSHKPSPPATQKQIDLLYKLNADFNAENISKNEAKVLIDEELKKRKK